MLKPLPGEVVNDLTPRFEFTSSNVAIDLEIYKDPQLQHLVHKSLDVLNGYTLPFELNMSTTYYWRIKTCRWSEVRNFTTFGADLYCIRTGTAPPEPYYPSMKQVNLVVPWSDIVYTVKAYAKGKTSMTASKVRRTKLYINQSGTSQWNLLEEWHCPNQEFDLVFSDLFPPLGHDMCPENPGYYEASLHQYYQGFPPKNWTLRIWRFLHEEEDYEIARWDEFGFEFCIAANPNILGATSDTVTMYKNCKLESQVTITHASSSETS